MKPICFICKKPKLLTKEHIIPQAIGGRLKDKIYCKDCNSTFGQALDNEISDQFGWVGTLLNIKRERGKTQPYTVKTLSSGLTLVFDGEGLKRKKPIVKISSRDGKKLDHADITARSEKELNEICASIKKRYKLSGDLNTFTDAHSGPTDAEKEITIDNDMLRRAVSKIAYGFLCIKLPKDTVLSSSFSAIRAYMKNGNATSLAHANFVHTKFMRDNVRPLHKIHVSLNRRENLLVGFVSLFGTYRFTILLSDDFHSQIELADLDYTFDPVRGTKVVGKENYKAPELTKDNILRPKQSRELVSRELNIGLKVIESYVTKFEMLNGELSL